MATVRTTKVRAPRPPRQPAPLGADAIWATWTAVRRVLPMWLMPFDALFSRGAWSMLGVDYISGLRDGEAARKIFAILGGLSPGDMRRVLALAQINQRRHEAISRWTAIAFVTLPLSFGVAINQLRPALFERVVGEWDLATVNTLGVVGLIVVYILACAWRARQIATIVEMGLIEHAVSFEGSTEDPEPPLTGQL